MCKPGDYIQQNCDAIIKSHDPKDRIYVFKALGWKKVKYLTINCFKGQPNPNLAYWSTAKVLCSAKDIPKGQEKILQDMLKSIDLETVKYAIAVLEGYGTNKKD